MTVSPAKKNRRVFWIKLALIAILIRIFFGFFPALCESLYSRGFYLWIRLVFDNTLGRLPFASIYLFMLLLFTLLMFKVSHLFRQFRAKQFCFKDSLFSLASFLSFIIFWFLLLWGFNYARIPIQDQLEIQLPESMDFDAIWEEAQYIKTTCVQLRSKIPNSDTNALNLDFYPPKLEQIMRNSLEEVLKKYHYPTEAQVRGRLLHPNGILLRFSSSGVYFPFTGEGHVDNGLHILTKPFTMAHELAHGYGFGSEASCNFLGFLACIHTHEYPAIQYSGYLMYWRYVYGALMEFLTEEEYLIERATISRGMHNDIEAIYWQQEQYAPFIPFLQPAIYDVFLKLQGVKEGIKSYNQMVLLVASWRKNYTN